MADPTALDLIQRLIDELRGELKLKVGWGEPDYADELIAEASAYLAAHPEPAADGPAVPDGREPVSVAAQSTVEDKP